MKRHFGLMALAAVIATSFASNADARESATEFSQSLPPIVQTDAGPVQGVLKNGMLSYLGIPFAAPPVGDLRWMPPQRPQSWTAVRQANVYGSDCSQNADLGVFARAGGTEDCLYLNVFADQKVKSDAKRPVFVWIYGGSLFVGSARDYNPMKFALEGGAIVVTFNYRLGLFGYFAHPSIDGEGHDFADYGFMDQQAALDWVQRNIERFGGDPSNVTISGESSGGNGVLAHVVSPASAGKFQHAIAMSGGSIALNAPNFGAPLQIETAERRGTDFAAAMGCEQNSAACLRALPAKRILDAQTPFMTNQLIVEGGLFPERPSEALKSGRFNRVTLINGSTSNEGGFFAGLRENMTGTPITADRYESALEFYFSKEFTPKVAKAYPLSNYPSPSQAFGAAAGDYLFACSGLAVTRWASAHTPVYAYEFADDTAPSYLNPTTFPIGAGHTLELAYIFPGFRGDGNPVALNPLQEKLSAKMIEYWSKPTSVADRSEWAPYDPAKDNVTSLVLPEPRMTERRFRAAHKCDFWDASGVY